MRFNFADFNPMATQQLKRDVLISFDVVPLFTNVACFPGMCMFLPMCQSFCLYMISYISNFCTMH